MDRGWEPRQNRGERKMREKSPPIVFHHDMYELLSLHICCWKENDHHMLCYAESPVSPSLNLVETHKDTCQQFSLVHSSPPGLLTILDSNFAQFALQVTM